MCEQSLPFRNMLFYKSRARVRWYFAACVPPLSVSKSNWNAAPKINISMYSISLNIVCMLYVLRCVCKFDVVFACAVVVVVLRFFLFSLPLRMHVFCQFVTLFWLLCADKLIIIVQYVVALDFFIAIIMFYSLFAMSFFVF